MHIFLPRYRFSTENCGEGDAIHYGMVPPPFLPTRTHPVHVCSWGGLLDLKSENMSFIFLPKQDAAPLDPAFSFILENLSQGNRFQLLSLRPIYHLPHKDFLLGFD